MIIILNQTLQDGNKRSYPLRHTSHIRINAVVFRTSTTYSPRDNAPDIPLLLQGSWATEVIDFPAYKWTATVTLTRIQPALFVAGAKHSWSDGSQSAQVSLTFLCRYKWLFYLLEHLLVVGRKVALSMKSSMKSSGYLSKPLFICLQI